MKNSGVGEYCSNNDNDMSGLLHRGTADTFSRSYSLRSGGNGNGKANVYNPNLPVPSPLQNFVKAKEKINSVFVDIQEYVDSVDTFFDQLMKDRQRQQPMMQSPLLDGESAQQSNAFRQSVKSIREMLSRDHMKVVFFGRTSNGKSTTINAMLHSRLLPSGMGHTTRCFVQVEGSTTGQQFILTEGSPTPRSVESIKELAHALCSSELAEDTLVRICWPKADSRLLQNEVVLVDSPGIDLSPEFDAWIDKHCLDADVFVLVSNAESTLTQTEKNFFHRVSTRLSKPHIFILNNRWDASAAEPELIEQVRAQHQSRFLKFLVDELKVCTLDEARHRIFFVSAREMLNARLKERGVDIASPSFVNTPAEGFQSRAMEFQGFERQFELCISDTAIHTKFEAHVERGREIISSLREMLENLGSRLSVTRENTAIDHENKASQLDHTQRQLHLLAREIVQRLQQLSAEVQLRVSTDLSDEIKRLDACIESFNTQQFGDEPAVLLAYKVSLLNFIDKNLNEKLQSRCAGGLLQRILILENELISQMSQILPDSYNDELGRLAHFRKPFAFTFAFNCPALCGDFREDLEFRFSLGLTSLIRRFSSLGAKSAAIEAADSGAGRSANAIGSSSLIPRSISGPEIAESEVNEKAVCDDVVMKSIVLTSAGYVANGGVGVLLVGGLVYRAVGWRVIALIGGGYLLIYVYERLSWNQRAKEAAFKRQLRSHLALRLRHISQAVTLNCDSQVSRELHEYVGRLEAVAGDAQKHISDEIDSLQRQLAHLDTINTQLGQTRGKAAYLMSELQGFVDSHLKPQ